MSKTMPPSTLQPVAHDQLTLGAMMGERPDGYVCYATVPWWMHVRCADMEFFSEHEFAKGIKVTMVLPIGWHETRCLVCGGLAFTATL